MAQSPLHRHHHQAMELFPNGGFVRLESRVTGMFVHADEDWGRVSMRPNGGAAPSLNAVWRVEHDDDFVLLQNAAYGRYLSFSLQEAPLGHRGRLVTQVDRDEPDGMNANPWPCKWSVQRLAAPGQDYVHLRYFNCYLRANGCGHFACNNGVTVEPLADEFPRISTMMHWKVHAVAASPEPQPLPLTPTHQVQGGCLSGLLFWQRNPYPYPDAPRKIRYVRATDDGDFDQNPHNWESFTLFDNSLITLKNMLGSRQEEWNQGFSAFTLCMRPGPHGRLMPLVAELPRSLEPMNIVVFKNGTPGAAALEYPAGPAP